MLAGTADNVQCLRPSRPGGAPVAAQLAQKAKVPPV
jgi:hypothetical protein